MSNGNCSFCGKSQADVFRLITSDGSKICSECVGRCANMLAEEFKKVAGDLAAHDLTFPKPDNGEAQS